MFWLMLGVLMWAVLHLFPSMMPAKRNELRVKYGNLYEGIFALKLLIALVLIVVGWQMTLPTEIYNPPSWGRHVAMLLVLIAIVLFATAKAKSRIRHYVRHPMLEGVAIWAVGHLFANGDSRSLVLFGGMLIWSLLNQFTINHRDGAWVKPEVGTIRREALMLIAAVVVYVVLMFLHPYFTGMPILVKH